MKNYIQAGGNLTVIAPSGGVVSGGLYKVGAIIGVAATTEVAGDPVVLKTEGVFDLKKTSAQAWAVGDPVFMNTTTRDLTNVSATGLVLVGLATEVASNPSSTGACRLNGVSAPAPV